MSVTTDEPASDKLLKASAVIEMEEVIRPAINYKEMKSFVKLANKLNAKAFFINYHRQIDSDELMQKLDISLPTHQKYNSLVKLLKHPIFKEECCVLNDYLKELKPNDKKLTNILKDLFKK